MNLSMISVSFLRFSNFRCNFTTEHVSSEHFTLIVLKNMLIVAVDQQNESAKGKCSRQSVFFSILSFVWGIT